MGVVLGCGEPRLPPPVLRGRVGEGAFLKGADIAKPPPNLPRNTGGGEKLHIRRDDELHSMPVTAHQRTTTAEANSQTK
jgi:hypothetical protein